MSAYVYVTDPYPLESKEFNKLYPFYDALKEGRFVNSECPDCKEMFWPPRTICPNCLNDKLEWKDLHREGTVVAFSVQESGVPKGFSAPLIFAVIKIDNKLHLFTRIVDSKVEDIDIGTKVTLVVEKVTDDRVLPVFKVV